MRKIPTLFKRDPENLKTVLAEVTPGCEWVLAGEGRATRKYDGTCVMFAGATWWARREIKPGKPWPAEFEAEQTDDVTGKTVGWVPMEGSSFARWHDEALIAVGISNEHDTLVPGTYELCGPKINGNREGFEHHRLIRHGADELDAIDPLTHDEIKATVLAGLDMFGAEGIVWHHPDGRMAKLKARDFPA